MGDHLRIVTRLSRAQFNGYSLVELMVTIAVISVIASIAIPMYRSYTLEGHFATLQTSLDGLRTPMEEFRLENGSYGTAGNLVGIQNIAAQYNGCPTCSGRFNWEPANKSNAYNYTVAVISSTSYDAWGVFSGNAGIWVRCDDRFTNCCNSESGGAATDACP
ncbi:MAG: prepilin-type N-terminal cleavage/methylation domain-containing protein [Chromatiaceae bacterium]|nr:prepilin-type N-terminal cleavage/methylation domain-containing protein [Chromatiaceae bacterium]